MAIDNLSEEQFTGIINARLHPSSPITSNEYLFGREQQLETIRRSISSPGRQIFIYGDRGVGKTSLAQTAAFLHQSADREPILVSCNASTTFLQIIVAILSKALGAPKKAGSTSHSIRASFGSGPSKTEAEYKYQASWDASKPPTAMEFNQAVSELANAAAKYSERTVVVIDEFDLIKSRDEKACFADLVKQIADQRIAIRLIFCGIGRSLEALLETHGSAYRYFEAVELERLTYGARFEIIDESAKALEVQVHDYARTRIAAVSDGFPHFVHLLCYNLYWEMYQDQEVLTKSTNAHYEAAVARTLKSAELHWKNAYDRATKRDIDDYEHILWATADHADLQRSLTAIRASYLEITNEMEVEPIPQGQMVTRLNTLKTRTCGQVLRTVRRSWYEFSESMLRGYVRLMAESANCPLASEYEYGAEPKRITAKAKAKARPLVHLTSKFKKPI